MTDDAPDGFADLRDAYTLFVESRKKDNAGQRGRFNLGEKLVWPPEDGDPPVTFRQKLASVVVIILIILFAALLLR